MGPFEILWKPMTLSPGRKAHTHNSCPILRGSQTLWNPSLNLILRSSLALDILRSLAETEHTDVKWGCMNCNSERNFSLTYTNRLRTLDRIQCLVTSCSSSSMKDFLALCPSWPFTGPRRASLRASHHYAVCVADLLTPQLDKPLEGRKLHLILLSHRIQHSAWHSFDKRLIKKKWINLLSYGLLHLGMI